MTDHPYSVFGLQYYPNLVSGEFVNVGVALVTHRGWWSVRIAEDLRDLKCLYPTAQPKALRSILGEMRQRLGDGTKSTLILEPASAEDPLNVIRRRTGNLNGSLRWSSPLLEGATDNPEAELDYWFDQLVQATDAARLAAVAAAGDSQSGGTLKTLMEREFVRRGVIGRLRRRRFEGYYRTSFEYTYQNGALNIFEPVRLNFKSATPILNRAQMWRGRLDVLGEEANRPLAFFALVDLPDRPDLQVEVESALTMIQRAQVQRVETVPASEVERFGQLVLEVVGNP